MRKGNTTFKHLFDAVTQKYLSGLCARQVAENFSISTGTVYNILKWNGVKRRATPEAARLAQPGISKTLRGTRRNARRVWERTNGPIPCGMCVHHKDGDHTNNSISNLVLMDRSSHQTLHLKLQWKKRHDDKTKNL